VVVSKRATPEENLLSIFSGASQLSFCTRDRAMRDAAAVASRGHVDAWYTDDGQAFERTAKPRVEKGKTSAA
jgi:hypothetical protein